MSWSLKKLLIALVIGVVTVSTGVISAYFIAKERAHLEIEVQKHAAASRSELLTKATQVTRTVTRAVERAAAVHDFLFLTEVMEATVKGDSDLVYGIIMDKDRRAIVHSNPELAHEVLDSPGDRTAAAVTEMTTRELQHEGQPVIEVMAPIVVADERWGVIRFGVSLQRLHSELAQAETASRERIRAGVTNSAAVAGLLILVGCGLGILFAGRIARPLGTLLQGVRRVEEGDLGGAAVEVSGSREVTQLAHAFNSMTSRLSGLLGEMAGRASLERELEVARTLQENMSPPAGNTFHGSYELAGRCAMAERCGGDWWTYRELDEGRLLVLIGDATGHGLPAAIVSSTAHGAVEAILSVDRSSTLTPSMVLNGMHHAIQGMANNEFFMTCFAMILDPTQGTVEYANAGHVMPLAYVRAEDGTCGRRKPLLCRGNPLGSADPRIGTGRRSVQPGEVLVLTTDGIEERVGADGRQFGARNLLRVFEEVKSAPEDLDESCRRLLEAVDEFGEGKPPADDMTVVFCRVAPEEAAVAVTRTAARQ